MDKEERKNTKTILLAALMILTLLAGVVFAGCSTGSKKPATRLPEPEKEVLSGPISKVAGDLTTHADQMLPAQGKLPQLRAETLTAATAKKDIGIAENDFTDNVQRAESFLTTQSGMPCQLTVLKCNDTIAAAKIKRSIAAGYNLQKWSPAAPEQCFVAEAGSYVLLFVGTKAQSEALRAGIVTLSSGKAGAPNVFFTGKPGGEAGKGEGGEAGKPGAGGDLATGAGTKSGAGGDPATEADKNPGTGGQKKGIDDKNSGAGDRKNAVGNKNPGNPGDKKTGNQKKQTKKTSYMSD